MSDSVNNSRGMSQPRPIHNMDQAVYQNICRALDVESIDHKDGRKLAEIHGMDRTKIRLIWEGKGAHANASPTNYLFIWWETNAHVVPTIAILREKLVEMPRMDVVRCIDKTSPAAQVTVEEMDSELRNNICDRLDIEDPFGNDYRLLAEKLGMDNNNLKWIWEVYPRMENAKRTDFFFKWWKEKGENVATVQSLRKSLYEMGRHDVVEIIDKAYPDLLDAVIGPRREQSQPREEGETTNNPSQESVFGGTVLTSDTRKPVIVVRPYGAKLPGVHGRPTQGVNTVPPPGVDGEKALESIDSSVPIELSEMETFQEDISLDGALPPNDDVCG